MPDHPQHEMWKTRYDAERDRAVERAAWWRLFMHAWHPR